MNIEKLVAAAKEIDRLATVQEQRSAKFAELARKARTATPEELRQIQMESRSAATVVVDYGDAVGQLRRALKSKPNKAIQQNKQPAIAADKEN